jgi:DNA replication protein DnaC
MNEQHTLQLMRALRLSGMADRFEAILTMNSNLRPTPDVLIAQLIEAEHLCRNHKRTQNYLRQARFRYSASIPDLIYTPDRNLNRETLASLIDNTYIDRGENIIITGATGCGKSYLACALGHHACLHGKKVAYFSLPKLLSKIKHDKIDGSFRKELKRQEKKDLLILDDWGLYPLDVASRLALLQIIEDRHNLHSTIITSQLPIQAWHEYINDHTIADAILDRIIYQAVKIELKGESLRKRRE